MGGSVSYASGQQPLVPVISPRATFDLLFKGDDPDASVRDALARKELRYSILDRVMDRTRSLSGKLSSEDALRLDQYTSGIRDLENRLVAVESVQCPEPARPRDGLPLPEHHALMRELMVLAVQCDYTRILSFMVGNSTSRLVYDHLDYTDRPSGEDHHDLSHRFGFGDDSYEIDLSILQNWIISQYVELGSALAGISDGEGGDLLEHTAMLYVTDWSTPDLHMYDDLTFFLTGGESAGWAHGRHRPQGGAAHSNVFLNLLDFVGVGAAQFGDNARTPIDLS